MRLHRRPDEGAVSRPGVGHDIDLAVSQQDHHAVSPRVVFARSSLAPEPLRPYWIPPDTALYQDPTAAQLCNHLLTQFRPLD
eukprot:144314-Pyramimonas_sp.AAC.1